MSIHTILLVAARTATDPHVLSAIRARAAEGAIAVTLLVPAKPSGRGWTWDEAGARREARARMHEAAANLRRAGIAAATVLGDFSPLEAIRDEMRRRPYDEIVISTLPTRVSRWLRTDLLTRVARESGVPVTHVKADAEPIAVARVLDRSPAA